jgi:hypothetical protein
LTYEEAILEGLTLTNLSNYEYEEDEIIRRPKVTMYGKMEFYVYEKMKNETNITELLKNHCGVSEDLLDKDEKRILEHDDHDIKYIKKNIVDMKCIPSDG